MSFKTTNFHRFVTSAIVMMVLISSAVPAVASTSSFQDVSSSYAESVEFLVANNYSKGVTATQFGTDQQITRGSAAVILANALDLPDSEAENTKFSDVPKRAAAAIHSLKQAGIINGKSASYFGFEDNLKRGEVALMLTQAAAYNLQGNVKNIHFKDVNLRYREAVAGMVDHNITNGKTAERFGTDDQLKRGEFAVFMYRAEMIKLTDSLPDSYSKLSQKLMSQEVSSIKLIGDSITAGMGVQGYFIPKDGRIIFSDDKGQVYREATHTTDVWANRLRAYMKNLEFGTVDVMNAGISGKSAAWTLKNTDHLMRQKEDAVVVMIGTNDRIDSSLKEYEANIRELLKIVDVRSEYMIVMSPPPSTNETYAYRFSAQSIDNVLKRISKEKGYTFISHFDAINEYLVNNPNVAYEDLMETQSPHPTKAGYKVMWQEMMEKLELK